MPATAVLADPFDHVGEIEVHTASHVADGAVGRLLGDRRADAPSLVTHVLGLPGRDVARDQVAERRVDPLQVVVAVLLRDLARILVAVLGPLRHPDPSVVAERLRHQGQFGLGVTVHRNAGRVDLGVARVAEKGALAVRPPTGGHVAAHRVGRQEEDVAVAARGQHDGVAEVRLDLAGDHVARDDAARSTVDDDHLQHLVPGVHRHGPGRDLTLQRLVGADQQLLAGLAACVKGALHLHTAERAVVEQSAVVAGERDALRHALVDDPGAHLGQPVHVGLTGAVVAALDRVVEQPERRIVVVAVVLGRVDAALRRDRVRAPRAVLVTEVEHVVAGLTQGRRCGAAGQTGADDDHREFAAVGRVDQLGLELALGPLALDRPGRRLGVAQFGALHPRPGAHLGGDFFLLNRLRRHHLTNPKKTATGGAMNARNSRTAMA